MFNLQQKECSLVIANYNFSAYYFCLAQLEEETFTLINLKIIVDEL